MKAFPTQSRYRPALLKTLEGEKIAGFHRGAAVRSSGELVFTTGMVGYTEALTDPSYYGQIVVFSYPLMGNYGVQTNAYGNSVLPADGFESHRIHAAGVVVGHDSNIAFHPTSQMSFSDWLCSQGVPLITGIDTRKLVQNIRDGKATFAQIDGPDLKDHTHFSISEGFFNPNAKPVIDDVSSKTELEFGKGDLTIGVVDCGVKSSILKSLLKEQCKVRLFPWNKDFWKSDCDGWLISNGPGNPDLTNDLSVNVARLFDLRKPILGVCLGHQILAKAAGATIRRKTYGHRGLNHPVRLAGTQQGFMTSQNHRYDVVETSLPMDWLPWFINANDGSLEGIRHATLPFRGVQFHPEAAPGPEDTKWTAPLKLENIS